MPHAVRALWRPSLSIGLLAASMLAPTLARAATDVPPIKPGLWEMVTESQQINGRAMPDHSAQMLEQMKSMPPAMRKQIEAQMKAQGIQMVPNQGAGTAVRMCLTAEMLRQNQWQRGSDRCENQVVSRSGNTWRWKMACPQPAAQAEGTTTFHSSESYSGEMRSTTDVDGTSQTMVMKHRARRISADCGDIKPMPKPAAAR